MQGMGNNGGKRAAFLNSVVGEGHAEKVKLEHKAEVQRYPMQIPRVRAFLVEGKKALWTLGRRARLALFDHVIIEDSVKKRIITDNRARTFTNF